MNQNILKKNKQTTTITKTTKGNKSWQQKRSQISVCVCVEEINIEHNPYYEIKKGNKTENTQIVEEVVAEEEKGRE